MPVNSTHPEYDAALPVWLRVRDVLAGEDASKRGGAKYVPRLESQTEDEFAAYVQRGFFYNATARTVGGYIGLIFRRDPLLVLPEHGSAVHPVLQAFVNDVDLRGTTLDAYARHTVSEVISLGRSGTLVDWQDEEARACIHHYAAESILNWRETRLHGRRHLSLLVLAETVSTDTESADPFVVDEIQQHRVDSIMTLSTLGRARPFITSDFKNLFYGSKMTRIACLPELTFRIPHWWDGLGWDGLGLTRVCCSTSLTEALFAMHELAPRLLP